jgi:tRNA 2-thiouridine synthesizing protein E
MKGGSAVTNLMESIIGSDDSAGKDPRFPHAPEGWTPEAASESARKENLTLGEDHWEALRALQEYYARHGSGTVNLRELHDALDEKFHHHGGIKHLYMLFPAGPVAQGCRIAGLKAPAGAVDRGFGSVA